MTWNCEARIKHADAGEHAVDHGRRYGAEPLTELAQAGDELDEAGEQHDDAEHLAARLVDELQTSTERPAAGPLTCSGAPEMEPTTMPPMMPVMMPAVGGMPEAIEMPMHSGSATRKTTIDARKSRPMVADVKGCAFI